MSSLFETSNGGDSRVVIPGLGINLAYIAVEHGLQGAKGRSRARFDNRFVVCFSGIEFPIFYVKTKFFVILSTNDVKNDPEPVFFVPT
jgi:hypothetical protein